MIYKLRILSLGAGVQSSTLMLMAERGEIQPFNCAIFADTGWESEATYLWLEYMRSMCKTPILTVRREVGIFEHSMTADLIRTVSTNSNMAGMTLPAHCSHGTHKNNSIMLRRQCTRHFKIEPIQKETRRLLGLKPRQRAPQGAVEQCVGISLDEARRMRLSQIRMTVLSYPLVDLGMTRHDCKNWLNRNGYPIPPKSACVGCPFRSNSEWRNIKGNPEAWKQAVELDNQIKSIKDFKGQLYLHRSCKPLEEVDLSTPEDRGQILLFDKTICKQWEFVDGLPI